ncbi:MAG: MarR family winged helix-turn-helix transcriptional regulator [Candidatus Dormibacteraceae bacterium]
MSKLDGPSLELWTAFLQAHAVVLGKLERDLVQDRALPLGWYEVLFWLSRAPGGRLRMLELARSVFLSKSGLTRLVDRLEAAGLVRRESCPSDRRGTWTAMTEAGRHTFRRAAPVHVRGIREHFLDRLEGVDVEPLREALARLVEDRVAPVRRR